ncbi:hypothetical protein [Fulvitalea axinellae]|uniref:hypothetical protein n=1 Tax=Fulvitalea axinellae TaxID=1182444 RepID=UPI0030CA27D0
MLIQTSSIKHKSQSPMREAGIILVAGKIKSLDKATLAPPRKAMPDTSIKTVYGLWFQNQALKPKGRNTNRKINVDTAVNTENRLE